MPDALSKKNVGNHPTILLISGIYPRPADSIINVFDKVDDLRYGTNPTQTAAYYGSVARSRSFIEKLKELKTGKEGPSQTNIEDIAYAALSVGYFDAPTVAVMKHENPSGFATQYEPEPLSMTYDKARDADFRAAFGGTVFFNRPVDTETAEHVAELFTEVMVAPGYDEGVVGRFGGSIRIFEYKMEDLMTIPRFTGDPSHIEIKTLPDGTVVRSDPLLTPIRTTGDLKQYVASVRQPSENELKDLLTGYRIRLRSNSIRMIKDGYTTGLGTGQQDRVMCIDIAAYKNRKLHELAEKDKIKRAADYSIPGSVLVSDGFFPFTDSMDLAKELKIMVVLAPHGGKNFNEVLKKADELGIVFVDLPTELRFFDHH